MAAEPWADLIDAKDAAAGAATMSEESPALYLSVQCTTPSGAARQWQLEPTGPKANRVSRLLSISWFPCGRPLARGGARRNRRACCYAATPLALPRRGYHICA